MALMMSRRAPRLGAGRSGAAQVPPAARAPAGAAHMPQAASPAASAFVRIAVNAMSEIALWHENAGLEDVTRARLAVDRGQLELAGFSGEVKAYRVSAAVVEAVTRGRPSQGAGGLGMLTLIEMKSGELAGGRQVPLSIAGARPEATQGAGLGAGRRGGALQGLGRMFAG